MRSWAAVGATLWISGAALAGEARTVGGVTASVGFFPVYGAPEGHIGGVPAITCLGAGAQHATAGDWLGGGEVGICGVEQGIAGFVGPELGRRFPVSPYLSVHATVGAGFGYINQSNERQRYTSFDVYVKPGVWLVGEVGGAQTQIGLQVYTPMHLAQFLSGDAAPRGFINPTIQLESRLYFGKPRRPPAPEPVGPTGAPPPTGSVSPPALAVPALPLDPAVVPLCPRGPTAPAEAPVGDAPLAIPAP
jgi:hypothetical protein